MDWKSLEPGDPNLIDKIVSEYMSKGQFDNLRRQLLSAVDTKPAYQNVKQRMENTVRHFLVSQYWRPDISKNQLRDSLKRQILMAPFLRPGIKRMVEQITNSSAMNDLRFSLENITRELVGVKNEPEYMETKNDEEDVENNELRIVNDDTEFSIKEEVTNENEEKHVENKLIDALENLEIPGEEVQSMEIISTLIDAETKPLPEAMETDVPEVVPDIKEEAADGELSGDDSDHSIINQMSPISVGNGSPPVSPVPTPISICTPIKRATDFIGKIPKVRKEDTKNSEVIESVDVKRDFNIPKNGESDDRKSKNSSDKKYSSEKSREKDKKSSSRSRDRSRDRSRKERDHRDRDRNRSSNDKDRHRRSDSRDKNRDRYRDKERDRHKGKYSSRDRHRSRDSDKSKDRISSKEKINSSSREKSEKVQSDDSNTNLINNEIATEEATLHSVDACVQETNSHDTVKTTEEASQGSQDSIKVPDEVSQGSQDSVKVPDEGSQGSQNSDKPVTEKRVFKISPMTTRSKGRRKNDSVTETVSETDNGDQLKASQGKKKGKSSVKR